MVWQVEHQLETSDYQEYLSRFVFGTSGSNNSQKQPNQLRVRIRFLHILTQKVPRIGAPQTMEQEMLYHTKPDANVVHVLSFQSWM